jgi:hypothetical protein
MEEVLDFKCCNLHEQNLEIQVTNTGAEPLQIPSRCDLEGEQEPLRLDFLYPPGRHPLLPGESLAFYCTLDERTLSQYRRIVFYDCAGRRHEQAL